MTLHAVCMEWMCRVSTVEINCIYAAHSQLWNCRVRVFFDGMESRKNNLCAARYIFFLPSAPFESIQIWNVRRSGE